MYLCIYRQNSYKKSQAYDHIPGFLGKETDYYA